MEDNLNNNEGTDPIQPSIEWHPENVDEIANQLVGEASQAFTPEVDEIQRESDQQEKVEAPWLGSGQKFRDEISTNTNENYLGGPMVGTTGTEFHILFATPVGRVGFRCLSHKTHRIRLETIDAETMEIAKTSPYLSDWKFDELPRASVVVRGDVDFQVRVEQALHTLLGMSGEFQNHAVNIMAKGVLEIQKKRQQELQKLIAESQRTIVINWTEKRIFSFASVDGVDPTIDLNQFLSAFTADNYVVLDRVPKIEDLPKPVEEPEPETMGTSHDLLWPDEDEEEDYTPGA